MIVTNTTDQETASLLMRVRTISQGIIHEIKSQYLEDSTPWIIGFSGGKDSTAVLQLIFYALAELPPNQLDKEVHARYLFSVLKLRYKAPKFNFQIPNKSQIQITNDQIRRLAFGIAVTSTSTGV